MDIALSCECGKVQGKAKKISPKMGNHVICYCKDCRTYARWLGRESMLDEFGGTDLWQMTPHRLELTEGKEQIRCMRLSPRGLLRWYTGCCKTPIANTLSNPKVPFVGIPTVFFKDKTPLGPVIEKAWGKQALGGGPADASPKASMKYAMRSFVLFGRSWWQGKGKVSPFFDATTLEPISQPEVISKEERQKYSDQG